MDQAASSEQRLRIGVIGGGIAGLTAAYRLAKQGHDVILWERAPRLGGQAAAFPVVDTALEYFYHHLFMSDREIVKLMDEIGIGDHLMWLPSKVGFFANGKIYPLSGATDLIRLGFIPFIDRIRIGLVTLYLQRTRDWKKFERVTAASWLRRAVGQRAFDAVWGAQLKAKFGQRYQDVAMVWFWNKIFLRTQSRPSLLQNEQLGYIRGSFNVLIDRLAEAIVEQGGTLKPGVNTENLEQRDGRWFIRTSEGEEVERDLILATVPSPILSRLVPDMPEEYRSRLSGAIYQGAVTLLLQSRRPLSDTYWTNIGDTSIPFTGIIEHTNFIDASHYQGWHFIYVGKYMDPEHPYFSMAEEDLFNEYVPHLQKINPDFDPGWVEKYWVFRERGAQPVITLHYSDRIPEHRTPLKGLYLANTSQIYPEDRGTNYSVRLGNDIATLIDDDWRAGRLK